ncbi:histidinol phosphate phosphatase [Pseudovibrio japonicus]|uniref:Histidinol phosphate phosphatase n=1 Tax=Pseudovibrio japonicus TaxID=366534 RepID=A0ABQ3ETM9_9HYPH|nr:inositol monophosphatase family protein [Pseudovibrio japonicus]GHB49901.1 histidinol phosphate phosphatase [Pseudovibrio japonicus]
MQNKTDVSVSEILDDCEAWAKSAAVLARSFFRKDNQLSFKEDDSPVTIADRQIEKELKAGILGKYPDFGIFGEESGVDGSLDGDLMVIDPIDGTRSFISGNPLFGLLLAYLRNGETMAGAISMPILNEIYTGGAGTPAKCNGKEISVSTQTSLDDAIIYINEGDKLLVDKPEQAERLLKSGKTRRFGYDCYSHALLASGHVDVVIDYDLKPYDFLAVSAVVRAAGGIVTDWNGNDLGLSSHGAIISAATPELHEEVLKTLNC